MRPALAVTLSLAVACRPSGPIAPRRAPVVVLGSGDGAPIAAAFVAGARAWVAIGFTVTTADLELEACPRFWPSLHAYDCAIHIRVYAVDGLVESAGSEGIADRATRTITYDRGSARVSAIGAHEVGHIVLDTPRHTQGGVMGGAASVLRDQDRTLACEVARLCR